jgi:8-amino-3,8-dideoxy-alpha-D-manno-octulosonate transaminase
MPGFELIGKKEKQAVERVFREGGVLFAHGFDKIRKRFHVREFEKMCSKKFKCKHSLSVSSGTAAIKIALKSLNVGPGDEVITQAFNFIATIEAILDVGAKPIIANVDDTLNINVSEIQKLISTKTKVILPVHMLGISVDMDGINKIAKKNNLKILEDNCESVGTKFNGKYLGTIGHVGALSFDYGKIITTGEGGMILTNDINIDKYAREYHDHGHENNKQFPRGEDTRTIYGFNYRMTELQGAIGKVQLSKLNSIILNNKKRYLALAKEINKLYKIRKIPSQCDPIYDCFIFFEEDKKLRKKIIDKLFKINIGTKNLPDAIKWHCSYYWDHALPKNDIKKTKKTYDLLSKAISIPIWLKRPVDEYIEIGKFIKSLK